MYTKQTGQFYFANKMYYNKWQIIIQQLGPVQLIPRLGIQNEVAHVESPVSELDACGKSVTEARLLFAHCSTRLNTAG